MPTTTSGNVHDAVTRIDALILKQVAIDRFGLVLGSGQLSHDKVGSGIKMEMIEDRRIMGRHEIPDIRLDGIVVAFVILALRRIDIAKLHLREEVILLPCRTTAKLDGFILAPELVRTFAIGHIRTSWRRNEGQGDHHHGQQRMADRYAHPRADMSEHAIHWATRYVHLSSHALAAIELQAGSISGHKTARDLPRLLSLSARQQT